MNTLVRIFSLGVLPILVASCSASSAPNFPSDPEIFRVGELEVRLYSDREQMIRSLPPIFTLLSATRVGNNQIQVSGYYDSENKRIYAINDARTVIHEFKHYLEPNWWHSEDPTHRGVPRNSAASQSSDLPVESALSRATSWDEDNERNSDF